MSFEWSLEALTASPDHPAVPIATALRGGVRPVPSWHTPHVLAGRLPYSRDALRSYDPYSNPIELCCFGNFLVQLPFATLGDWDRPHARAAPPANPLYIYIYMAAR